MFTRLTRVRGADAAGEAVAAVGMESGGVLAGRTLGGYRLVSLLGVGGMAEVYRARDEALDRDVAVKVLPQALALDPGYVQRFRDEGRRVAALDHPHVVPVYQFGDEGGLLFLVMPLLRESLRDRMIRSGTLPPLAAARITLEIAEALDAAHALGLVHRDVKPENVLLDGDGKALLTDFGIARAEERLREAGAARTLAATGLPVGTPEYMAPEQLKAETIDHRVDVYGLGAVLYELLTGAVPYDGATPYEVAAKVLTAPLTPPSAHNASLWPELDSVIMTALAKIPAERYSDVRGFAAALHRAILRHDSSVTDLTLPAGWAEASAETIPEPALAATSPTTASALPAPATPASPAPWGQRYRALPVTNRKALVALAAVLVLLIGVCGGSGLALLNHLSGDGSAAGLLSSLSGGSTETSGASPATTNTAGNGSVSNSDATTGTGAPPGGGAVPTVGAGTPLPASASPTLPPAPGATATATPPSTPTAIPTPLPTPTSTPGPAPLVLSPSNNSAVPLNRANGYCTGTQTITNVDAMAVSWRWTSVSPTVQFLYYTVGGSSGWGMPHSTTAPGATDTLQVSMSCSRGQTNTVTMTDSLGNSYTFTLTVG